MYIPDKIEEIQRLDGHSIEDFVHNVEWSPDSYHEYSNVRDAVSANYMSPRQDIDKSFFDRLDCQMQYEQGLVNFVRQKQARNPHQSVMRIDRQQAGWLQVDSVDFIREKVAGFTENPAYRLYFNPQFRGLLGVYTEVFNELENAGIPFRSKVFDLMLRNSGEVEQQSKRWAIEKNNRTDPLVFYLFQNTADKALNLANGVYDKYKIVFQDRKIPCFPYAIAAGYGVGAEPKGLTGVESLSSHREGVVSKVYDFCAKDTRWLGLSVSQKQSFFAKTFRLNAHQFNIDPNNIAFNTV